MATSKAEEYRAKAREAEQLAEKTVDSVSRNRRSKLLSSGGTWLLSKKNLGDLRSTDDHPHPPFHQGRLRRHRPDIEPMTPPFRSHYPENRVRAGESRTRHGDAL